MRNSASSFPGLVKMKNKIAIVEDDELIRDMIKVHLEKNGFEVECFSSSESFLNMPGDNIYDLIILDFILPGLSGEQLLMKIRGRGDDTPVLFLTVKDDIPTRIRAFHTGADDYVTKPFNLEVLLARSKALIRRSQGRRRIPSSRILVINNLKIDTTSRVCESNIGEVILSEKEMRLLVYLTQHSGESLSRADILEEVWGMDVVPTPRTVDNFILKFRKLFEDNPKQPRHFLSVRSKGYRFVE